MVLVRMVEIVKMTRQTDACGAAFRRFMRCCLAASAAFMTVQAAR